MTARWLKQVQIIDDRTGEMLADVDAASLPDALAYYLRSRHLVEDATEQSVTEAARYQGSGILLFESRHPITGAVEVAVFAKEVVL